MESKLKFIIRKYCYKNKIYDNKEIMQLQDQVISKYENGEFDFKNSISYKLYTTSAKKRKLAIVKDGTTEYFIFKALNQIIQNKIKPHYESRNKMMIELFDNLKLFHMFKDFTVVRFDFKNYFDSISSEYVLKKCMINYNFSKVEMSLLQKYVDAMPMCKPGLSLSNTFAEEMGRVFDEKIKTLIPNIVFYKRYVDDGILILNKVVAEKEIKNLLQLAIDDVFFDKSITSNNKNKTKIDFDKKFNYITRDKLPNQFDFLGYQIKMLFKGDRVNIELGISDKKQKKYYQKTKHIISKYYKEPQKLRLILKCLSRRCVYTVSRNNDINKWISKGITHNYGDLFYFKNVDKSTASYLSALFIKIFKELNLDLPNYLKSKSSAIGYNLFENIKKNKAIIFDEKIGVSISDLKKWIKIVNPGYNTDNRRYFELVKEFLIKCHVGY